MSEQSTSAPIPEQEQVEYRDIVGHPGYRVGTDGSVWSCKSRGRRAIPTSPAVWRRMKTTVGSHGYHLVGLRAGRANINLRYVHRLVLEAFVGPCPAGLLAAHYSGDKNDNRICNLRWDTPASNTADSRRHGTIARGERNGHAKLTEASVRRAIVLRAAGWLVREIAADLEVSTHSVGHALRGDTWKHLTSATASRRKWTKRKNP